MSISSYNSTTGELTTYAGSPNVDQVLSASSKNPIANKAVYNALAEKIEKTVNDLVNYYTTSQVYNKAEVRELIGAINTLTLEVVGSLPTSDISDTTIYLVGPTSGNYDEYIHVGNTWVKIGDTQIDLSNYVTSEALTTALQSYYTKTAVDALLDSYYTKTEITTNYYDKTDVDDLLDDKQDTLTFDSTPTANSSNPVTSNGIKTAIDAKKFSNPNLLDNPFFSVNSRGESVYAGEGIVSTYCVDRWSLYNWWSSSSTTACVINSDGTITLNNNTESSNRQFVQFVPFEYLRVGESYTASIDVVSITGSASFNMQQDTSPWTGVMFISSITSPGIKTGTKNWVEVTDTKVRLFISLAANTSITIRAMKLEKGSISTLNLDTVPNYATELAKCRASKADSTDTFANQGSYFLSADNGILGAKNLLPNNATTTTKDGITFTVNSDGSIGISSTNSETNGSYSVSDEFLLKKGSYKLSRGKHSTPCPSLYIAKASDFSLIAELTTDSSTEEISFTLDADVKVKCWMWYIANHAYNTTFYPMIRLASDTNDTYQPYAKTNKELTECHTTVAKTFTQSSTDVATYLRNANTSSYIAFGYSYNRTMITVNAIFTIKTSGNALYKSDGTTVTSGNENWELIKISNFPYSKAIPDGPLSGLLFLNRTDLKDLYCSKRGNDLIFAISATDYADFVGKGVRLSATIMLK